MSQQDKMLEGVFRAVWKSVAGEVPVQEYMNANQEYRKYFGRFAARDFGDRILSESEMASLPDNSSDYEEVKYVYYGLESVRNILNQGESIAFVTWHHGARLHADYAIVRVLPETVIFTKKTFQYGKIFSYPMLKGRGLSLFKMTRLLDEGRPILYYLDGAPIGEKVQLPSFGVISNFSTAPIKCICSVKGVKIIPVTNYYRNGDTVEVIFHPPLKSQQPLNEVKEEAVLSTLLRYFEADQRKRAPEQVMWWYIPYREQQATEMGAK
jgi:lauroyl/myristoyl acyltransferase